MKKSKEATQSNEVTFTMKRLTDGWAVIKVTTNGEKVVSTERISEPDMLPIATGKLIQAIKASV